MILLLFPLFRYTLFYLARRERESIISLNQEDAKEEKRVVFIIDLLLDLYLKNVSESYFSFLSFNTLFFLLAKRKGESVILLDHQEGSKRDKEKFFYKFYVQIIHIW